MNYDSDFYSLLSPVRKYNCFVVFFFKLRGLLQTKQEYVCVYVALEEALKRSCFFKKSKIISKQTKRKIIVILCLFVLPVG